ncbi:hypothetical protein ACUNDX_02325 [Serratia sp. IR-2025]|uniref:hypothetical protein n=1 Tax=Serratia marcescens TaxID=615 RepID=UPI0027E57B0C|nr:hypothetical protein [Serratia marcescens]
MTITSSFNNPFLNPSQVGSPLLLDSTLALYEMRSIYDRSPNGNHLILNDLVIDEFGLASDGIEGHNAYTGISEPSAFTVVTAINVPVAPAQTTQIFSSIAESGSPLTGCRLAITNTGLLTASIGSSPGVTLLNCGSAVGGWTIFATKFSDDGIMCLRMGGEKYQAPLAGTRNYAVRPIILAGGYVAPHNIGIPGHIGLFGAYNGAFSESEMMTLIQKGRTVMKGNGVNI